jgi:hypothetical protein
MRYLLAGALLVVGVAGCSRAGGRENVGAARDTVATPRQTEDTTIITSDTTVKEGQGSRSTAALSLPSM